MRAGCLGENDACDRHELWRRAEAGSLMTHSSVEQQRSELKKMKKEGSVSRGGGVHEAVYPLGDVLSRNEQLATRCERSEGGN